MSQAHDTSHILQSLLSNVGDQGFFAFVVGSKESDLIVVFGENAAALIGTVLAFLAFFASWKTGDGRFDALGSILVGVVLIGVAIFLTMEVKSLLIGESADPRIRSVVERLAVEDPRVNDVREVITVQQGPGEVLVALKISCPAEIEARAVSRIINDFEARLRAEIPQARWIFVEPDLDGTSSVRS